jgi:outer membrane lipoprotein SlyB
MVFQQEVVMRFAFNILFAAALAAVVAGCASSVSGGAYSRAETGREEQVRLGVVMKVREVQIEGTKSGVGTVGGAAVGGIAGSNVGQGKGSSVGTILGVIVGGVAGSAAEEGMTRQKGFEITVKLDTGGIIAVVQGADEKFAPGDRVQLLSEGGKTRVTHY